ncbi:MAG: hypothetical protein Q8927_10755 [Bacteroidota bacterium]|nr:hypothetical protein [Bacteroidota bacterium]MDP4216672.1 hypothetical protein [Bacteroidota bacterium]MDP4244224.1 hypothetical protein [Bacteroidota bacterium]MDP4253404.1 hypothetical protein [Bacteroidota bacterium]MDP4258884.1 hypothetical protein [Bacteroidota bacterium]
MKTVARCLFTTLIFLAALPGIRALANSPYGNDPHHHGPTWAEENSSRVMRMHEYESRTDFGRRRGPHSADPASGPNVPLNGGMAILLVAGIGFGIWKVAAGKSAPAL